MYIYGIIKQSDATMKLFIAITENWNHFLFRDLRYDGFFFRLIEDTIPSGTKEHYLVYNGKLVILF